MDDLVEGRLRVGAVPAGHEHLPEIAVGDVQMKDRDTHPVAVAGDPDWVLITSVKPSCLSVLRTTPLYSPIPDKASLTPMLRVWKKRNAMFSLRLDRADGAIATRNVEPATRHAADAAQPEV